jgi:hypothetical protein
LTRFSEKRAGTADLTLLELLCDLTKNTSLCGLGQSAPNPVLSTLRHFRDEYVAGMVTNGFSGGGAARPDGNGHTVIPLTVVAGGMPSSAGEGGRT